jgi:hypothetical protein
MDVPLLSGPSDLLWWQQAVKELPQRLVDEPVDWQVVV